MARPCSGTSCTSSWAVNRSCRRIARARVDYGVAALAAKGAGTRELMRALGRGQSVALMNDQKFNQGLAAPFFGHDAMTAPGPTRLAMKYGAPLIPLSTIRTGPARYRVTVYDPITADSGLDEEAAIFNTVVKINQFVEARIHDDRQGLFVKTRRTDDFYLLLNRVITEHDLQVESVAPVDDDLNAVYQYLITADGGKA